MTKLTQHKKHYLSEAIYVRLTEATHTAMKEEAERQNRTMSNLVGVLIENYLKMIQEENA